MRVTANDCDRDVAMLESASGAPCRGHAAQVGESSSGEAGWRAVWVGKSDHSNELLSFTENRLDRAHTARCLLKKDHGDRLAVSR